MATAEDAFRAAQKKEAEAKAAAKAKADSTNKSLSDLNALFGPSGKYQVALDEYGNLVLAEQLASGQRIPKFAWIKPDGSIDIQSGTQVIASIKGQFKTNLDALRKSLYDRGYMSEKEYTTKSESAFNSAILRSAQEHSAEQVQNFTVNKSTTFATYNKWLSGKGVYGKGTGGGSGTGSETNLSTRTDTDQAIDEYMFAWLGRKATKEEKDQYFNKVNTEEKNAIVKRSVSGDKGTTTGNYLTNDDYERIKSNILKPIIKASNPDELIKSNGQVAQNAFTIKEFAASYGIRLDTKQALDKVLDIFSPNGQIDIDIAKNSIKSMAKGFYANLSSLIDEGVKPSDIANQYAYYKSQLLEIPSSEVSIFDEDIQAALANRDMTGAQKAGVMSYTDYEKMLRTSPKTKQKWLQTKKAKEEAAGYANSILRSFGLQA
jgi:hypothetical protein